MNRVMSSGVAGDPASLRGDPALLRLDIAALVPDLRAFARFLARDRIAADDLVQDAVVRALDALGQFVPGTSLRNWMFTILRNTHYEQARRRRTEQRVLEAVSTDHAGPAAQHGQAELSELQRFLWTLPVSLREALVLVGAQGLSYAEAAIVCGVAEGTVKARVSRGRHLLAERMAAGGAPVAGS
jgi:RNA polymerase sigma-70 factor (ECF subfamily)